MTGSPLRLEHFESSAGAMLHPAIDEEAEALEQALLEQAEADAREQARQRSLDRLSDEIGQLASLGQAHRTSAIQAIADAIETSIAAMFSRLAATGFPAEVAASVQQVLHQAEIAKPTLAVSPDDYEVVLSACSQLSLEQPVEIVEDSSASPGTAVLRWTGGGGEVSAEAIGQQAQDLLDQQIRTLLGRRTGDE